MAIAKYIRRARAWIAAALRALAQIIAPAADVANVTHWPGPSAVAVPDDHSLIAAINLALASGVNTVELDGQKVTYGSSKEMLQDRDRLVRLQAEKAGD